MVSSISSAPSISQLFAKIDTKSQGYIEKSDLASAFSKIGSSSSSDSSSVDEVFAALDSDSDGKVSESEFSTKLSQLQQELDGQFNAMRMNGFGGPQGGGGMAPPPPPQDDSGFTQDELQSQLDSIGSSDDQRSAFISNIVSNFDEADSDGDGKVSFAEAQSYNGDSQGSGKTDTASTDGDALLMKKIMQLMQAYGGGDQSQQSSALSSLLSISA